MSRPVAVGLAGQSFQPTRHHVCVWHAGQRIQWLCRREGSHTEMLTRRIPRSTSVERVRTLHAEHSMITVPVWRGPVEKRASRPSFWLPGLS